MNVARHLRAAAAAQPEAPAIVAALGRRYQRVSFAELDAHSDALARGLLASGFSRGERTLVMVRAGIELISVTYALLKAGMVPVLIDPGMGLGAFLACVERTQPTALVGIPAAHLARLLFRRSFRCLRRHVTVGRRLLWGGPTLHGLAATHAGSFALADTADTETAAVLFTSGSTGPAKGAVYSHGNFDAQIRVLLATYGFERGEVDLAAFPLFSLFDNALGMTSVIPDLDPSRPGRCDPARVVAAIVENRATTAFGSPAVWRRVVPYCQTNGIAFPLLRRVLIAGACVPPSLIEPLKRLLPNGDVHTPYGATEALPVATISGAEVMGETAARSRAGDGTCVGRAVAEIEVRLIRITDAPIATWSDNLLVADGVVGEICVRGPVVTTAYDRLPRATELAKIRAGDGVWHRMGDLGYRDAVARIWFCGRKAERVETASGPLYTDRLEGIAAAHPGVGRCALVGVGAPGHARPVLVVEGREDPRLAQELKRLAPVEAVLFHPRFPVDVRHNAKIHRLTLKAWAESRLT